MLIYYVYNTILTVRALCSNVNNNNKVLIYYVYNTILTVSGLP